MIDIVGQARRKTVIDGSTREARSDSSVADKASVKALAVVARMIISSAALSSIADRVTFLSRFDVVEFARSAIASKHAIEARAKAINDVCCCSFGNAAST